MCTGAPAMPDDSDDGDVWADGSEDDFGGHSRAAAADRRELEREGAARHQQFYNAGYRDGLEEGKERTLQRGFDAGFREGAAAGFEWGLLRGAARTLAILDGQAAPTRGQHEQILALAAAAELPPRDVMHAMLRHLLSTHAHAGAAAHGAAAGAAADAAEPRGEEASDAGVAGVAGVSGRGGGGQEAAGGGKEGAAAAAAAAEVEGGHAGHGPSAPVPTAASGPPAPTPGAAAAPRPPRGAPTSPPPDMPRVLADLRTRLEALGHDVGRAPAAPVAGAAGGRSSVGGGGSGE